MVKRYTKLGETSVTICFFRYDRGNLRMAEEIAQSVAKFLSHYYLSGVVEKVAVCLGGDGVVRVGVKGKAGGWEVFWQEEAHLGSEAVDDDVRRSLLGFLEGFFSSLARELSQRQQDEQTSAKTTQGEGEKGERDFVGEVLGLVEDAYARARRGGTERLVSELLGLGYTEEEWNAILSQAAERLELGGFAMPLSDDAAERIYNHLFSVISQISFKSLLYGFAERYFSPQQRDGLEERDLMRSLKHAVLLYLSDTGRKEEDNHPLVLEVKSRMDGWRYHTYYFVRHLILSSNLERYIRR